MQIDPLSFFLEIVGESPLWISEEVYLKTEYKTIE